MLQYKTNQFAFQMNCSMYSFYYRNPVYLSKCSIKENNKKYSFKYVRNLLCIQEMLMNWN